MIESESGHNRAVDEGSRGARVCLYLCKTRCQREDEATDRQIDQLVYELYGNLIPI